MPDEMWKKCIMSSENKYAGRLLAFCTIRFKDSESQTNNSEKQ